MVTVFASQEILAVSSARLAGRYFWWGLAGTFGA